MFRISPQIDLFLHAIRRNRNACLVLCAGHNSGKTTRLRHLIEHLRPELSIAGVIAESTKNKDAYFARNIASGEIVPLMEEGVEIGPGDFAFNRFIVHQTTFNKLTETITALDTADIIAIDEVGRMEIDGKGWFQLLQLVHAPLIITVRDRFLDAVKADLLTGRSPILVEKIISEVP